MHGLQVTAVLAGQILLGKLQLELPLSVSFPGAASQSGNLQINKTTHFYQDINLQHVLHMQHWICISLTELKHKSTCHNSTCLCSTTDCSICMYVTWDCSITLLHAHLIHRQLPHVLLHPGGGQPWRRPAVPLAHGLHWPLCCLCKCTLFSGKCLRCHNKHMSLVTAHYSPSDSQMSCLLTIVMSSCQ